MSNCELVSLRRQVRIFQVLCAGCLGAFLLAAVRPASEVIHAKGIVIEDAGGHPRLLMGAPVPLIEGRRSDVTTSIVMRDAAGHDRVIVGEEPNPMIGGKVLPRIGASWGIGLFNSSGDERGGLVNFDQGRSAIALDRASGDGIGLLVDEKENFARLLINYDSGKVGSYKSAVQFGTAGRRLVGNISNFDGGPAGSVTAGAGGPAITSRSEAK